MSVLKRLIAHCSRITSSPAAIASIPRISPHSQKLSSRRPPAKRIWSSACRESSSKWPSPTRARCWRRRCFARVPSPRCLAELRSQRSAGAGAARRWRGRRDQGTRRPRSACRLQLHLPAPQRRSQPRGLDPQRRGSQARIEERLGGDDRRQGDGCCGVSLPGSAILRESWSRLLAESGRRFPTEPRPTRLTPVPTRIRSSRRR